MHRVSGAATNAFVDRADVETVTVKWPAVPTPGIQVLIALCVGHDGHESFKAVGAAHIFRRCGVRPRYAGWSSVVVIGRVEGFYPNSVVPTVAKIVQVREFCYGCAQELVERTDAHQEA